MIVLFILLMLKYLPGLLSNRLAIYTVLFSVDCIFLQKEKLRLNILFKSSKDEGFATRGRPPHFKHNQVL